jgi:chorismate mutase
MTKDQFNFQMDIQRRSIDEIDHQIYVSLLNRYKHISKIAEIKKEYGTMEMSETRKKEIIDKLKGWAIEDGLPVTLVNDIYNIIFEFSILEQILILNDK